MDTQTIPAHRCSTCFTPVTVSEAVAIPARRWTEYHHKQCWHARASKNRALTRLPYRARRTG